MKLRLTGGGFQNYTGQMGVVYFKNGLSEHDVNPNDAIRIAGSIGAEWENGAAANVGDIYTQNLNSPVPSIEQQSGLALLQQIVGVKNADEASRLSTAVAHAQLGSTTEFTAEAKTETASTSTVKYTAESLAEIADQGGLAGLREVAKDFGVTGNSIAIIIERILEKQG